MKNFGVLGRSLAHTLSPEIHGMIYERTGYRASYGVFEVEPGEVKDVIPAMRTLGIAGINVTIPYKQDIMAFLDRLSPEAEAIGAVNTVHMEEDGSATGYNTDAFGFARSLAHNGVEAEGKSFVLCGMSGAGRAVRCALEGAGAAEITVASTDPSKGIPYAALEHLPPKDVIVNCTPLGMYPKSGAAVVGEEILSRYATAVDLVYNPLETLFLRTARQRGLRTVDGLYMLVFQGIRSFSIWTGVEPEAALADEIYNRLKDRFL